MEEWPEPKWGHPLPKVTKYLRPRALIWLAVLVGVTGLSVLGSYIHAKRSINKNYLLTFPDQVIFPFSSEFKDEANHLVSKIDPNAKLISISYVLADPETEEIKYHPVLVYCIPQNPAWYLELNIQVNRSGYSQNHYQASKLKPEESDRYTCSSNKVTTPSTPAPEAILIAQRFLKDNYPPEVFQWPDKIQLLNESSHGYTWEITYDDFFGDSAPLEFRVKSGSGVVTVK